MRQFLSQYRNTEARKKVKVRQQLQQDDNEYSPPKENGALLFLKIIESLSVQEKENQSDSPPALIARITKPNVPSLTTPPVSSSKVKNNKIAAENNKAQSISRPRAVLSSPANDGMIGSLNMVNNNERSSALRKCNSEPKKPTQIKAIARQAKAERPLIQNMKKGIKPAPNTITSIKNKKKGPSSRLRSSNGKVILEQEIKLQCK